MKIQYSVLSPIVNVVASDYSILEKLALRQLAHPKRLDAEDEKMHKHFFTCFKATLKKAFKLARQSHRPKVRITNIADLNIAKDDRKKFTRLITPLIQRALQELKYKKLTLYFFVPKLTSPKHETFASWELILWVK